MKFNQIGQLQVKFTKLAALLTKRQNMGSSLFSEFQPTQTNMHFPKDVPHDIRWQLSQQDFYTRIVLAITRWSHVKTRAFGIDPNYPSLLLF